MSNHLVAAFYKFITIEDVEKLHQILLERASFFALQGVLLVAGEGINGTLSGAHERLRSFLSELRQDERFSKLDIKFSECSDPPFHRLRVRKKKEIVTLGVEGIDPREKVGTYIDSADWNDLIEREDVVLVDTRNDYEVVLGTFKGAINPKTESFRDFPRWVSEHLDAKKHRKVAMFCTGGIRCEKASSFLLEQGFEEVFHLKGGILKYLNEISEDESSWEGECFLFDRRVGVTYGVKEGTAELCFACSFPILECDRQSEHYREGVCCTRCYDRWTPEQMAGFEQRHLQMQLAKKREGKHLGQRISKKSSK
ncbi:MAG: hypothetical protein CMK59_15425 [Proteobacteria bacterium]|nr:hypothetical protein [Pseudomonadota bacterium]